MSHVYILAKPRSAVPSDPVVFRPGDGILPRKLTYKQAVKLASRMNTTNLAYTHTAHKGKRV